MSEWISFQDSEWTPGKLSAELAHRSHIHEAEFGPLDIDVQPFISRIGEPQPPEDRPYNADLYNHLRELNNLPPSEIAPGFKESSATRIPWVGGILDRARRQFHNLVLFYINRASGQQNQVNEALVGTLNELTRAVEAQREFDQSTKSDSPKQKGQQERT